MPLQLVDHFRPAEGLGVEALGGQEQDSDVRCVWGGDVFLADVLSRLDDCPLQGLGRLFCRVRVGPVLGVLQAAVVLLRELGVDG